VAHHNAAYEGQARLSQPARQLPVSYTRVTVQSEPRKDFDWTCPVADVKGCPVAAEPLVEVPAEMFRAWVELAEDYSTEWIAYLIGEVDQAKGTGVIREMYFPPQSASGAHVELPDSGNFRARPGTVGAIHSHVQMSAFFSRTDEDHANWPIEIVVNAKGEYCVRVRVKLECSRYSRIDGKLKLVGIRASELYQPLLKEALKPARDTRGYGDDDENMMLYGVYGGKGMS
jgi:proteasome lid subunit RPN8/RPN11